MTLQEQADLVADNNFRSKIAMAMNNQARALIIAGSNPVLVAKYASHIINNIGGGWLNSAVYQVIANPVIDGASTDSDIQYTVNSAFEDLAEAHYANI